MCASCSGTRALFIYLSRLPEIRARGADISRLPPTAGPRVSSRSARIRPIAARAQQHPPGHAAGGWAGGTRGQNRRFELPASVSGFAQCGVPVHPSAGMSEPSSLQWLFLSCVWDRGPNPPYGSCTSVPAGDSSVQCQGLCQHLWGSGPHLPQLKEPRAVVLPGAHTCPGVGKQVLLPPHHHRIVRLGC